MKRSLRLISGASIPLLGFGTWQLEGSTVRKPLEIALDIGYRHIDTADKYYNHRDIGAVLSKSTISREELFITSKIWRDEFVADNVEPACRRILSELGIEYLDLFLMHWPNKMVPFAETLPALQKLKDTGLVRAIGVSNCTINHLKDILKTGVRIDVNQVEFHPSLYQKDLLEFCRNNDIILTAYSPIAQGKDFMIPIVQSLAQKYNRSPSQVILNWIMQKNIVVVPKATSRDHIEDNFKSQEWELSPEDHALLDMCDTNTRIVVPDFNEFTY